MSRFALWLRASLAPVLTLALAAVLVAAPAVSAQAAPLLALSPTSGPAGSAVTVTGSGFPKKTAGTVSGGQASVTFTTTAKGSFSAQVLIPPGAAGQVVLTATVRPVSASAAFTVLVPEPVPEPTPAPAPAPAPTTVPTPAPAVSTARLQFGVTTPGGPLASAELDQVTVTAGEAPGIILSYKDFAQPVPVAELDAVVARGATPLITWEPWLWGGGVHQPAYTSNRIAAGAYDDYLRSWANGLREWGKPLMLRYGHEMNGTWYPWADGVNGNGAGDYVAAWRHVHDLFSAAGATNVSWVWNANVPYQGSVPLASVFPGTAYVDVVGLDGYNWGTAASWSSWQMPWSLFGPGLDQLRTLAPGTPILIGETASAELGGNKPEWNWSIIAYLNEQPDVIGFVWFDHNKETDWRIASSPESAGAFRDGLANRRAG